MRLSERARALDAQIQINPTSEGWTVRALWFEHKGNPFGLHMKCHQKRWTKLKELPINDHRFAHLKSAIDEAIEWLDLQTKET